jgi:hypothetical protein
MGYCRLTWSQMAKWQRLRQFQYFIEFLRSTGYEGCSDSHDISVTRLPTPVDGRSAERCFVANRSWISVRALTDLMLLVPKV